MPKNQENEESAGVGNAALFGEVKMKKAKENGVKKEAEKPLPEKKSKSPEKEEKQETNSLMNAKGTEESKMKMEDEALDLVVKGFKHYRKESIRLQAENDKLWEENERIKKAYEKLKDDAMQLKNLMSMVTGEMSSALGFMEKASKGEDEEE
ncbi:Oidioi.mRNA.OKI2018_I69.chr1.g693.t1.cds [Oikopleura dioica]|uniref:Oidioi.mRNA.OKI2018_I69.chr1.g693.t1.cds n=1 Tax=Oikopleura dioica TaxID=34765 RepID=A0ABN7SRX9_OIKDI|nr:Oidioi.mRNA.OKI2018_I69.chr1.g693.t1.cds [Oikopleura dioica]